MELLIVILIIAIIAGMSMMALAGAAESAREQRTRSIINRIDSLIRDRYDSYRTRSVPVRVPAGTSPRIAAMLRLYALRDLMRMELPDRRTDVVNYSATPVIQTPPILLPTIFPTISVSMASLQRHYYRAAVRCTGGILNNWTPENQGSECLYLILSTMKDGDKSALDFFLPEEIGDTDEDGMKEILDGWGSPILFLRWAPGYVPDLGPDGIIDTNDDGRIPQTMQTLNFAVAPDPFDPLKVDPHWPPTGTTGTYALYPLIVSPGRDKILDISTHLVDSMSNDFRYATTTPPNNPYNIPAVSGQLPLGTVGDINNTGEEHWADNITNHYQAPP